MKFFKMLHNVQTSPLIGANITKFLVHKLLPFVCCANSGFFWVCTFIYWFSHNYDSHNYHVDYLLFKFEWIKY
jgi:hypothetical protein